MLTSIVLPLLYAVLMLIVVNPDTLVDQRGCQQAGEFHFVITQVEDEVPGFILVDTTVADDQTVLLQRYVGKTAHYSLPLASPTELVENARAHIYDTWVGNFNLSCEQPTAVELIGVTAIAGNEQSEIKLLRVMVFLLAISLLVTIGYFLYYEKKYVKGDL